MPAPKNEVDGRVGHGLDPFKVKLVSDKWDSGDPRPVRHHAEAMPDPAAGSAPSILAWRDGVIGSLRDGWYRGLGRWLKAVMAEVARRPPVEL